MTISSKNILFDKRASEDFEYWIKTNPKIVKKIIALIDNIRDTPFSGMGKPEQLKYHYTGCWSRRINQEHRLVYQVKGEIVKILAYRYHY